MKTSSNLTRRQRLVILTLADIRQDVKFYKLTGSLPAYADSIYELKEIESHYSASAYNLRNKIN
jgi:hypothetical protein